VSEWCERERVFLGRARFMFPLVESRQVSGFANELAVGCVGGPMVHTWESRVAGESWMS